MSSYSATRRELKKWPGALVAEKKTLAEETEKPAPRDAAGSA